MKTIKEVRDWVRCEINDHDMRIAIGGGFGGQFQRGEYYLLKKILLRIGCECGQCQNGLMPDGDICRR